MRKIYQLYSLFNRFNQKITINNFDLNFEAQKTAFSFTALNSLYLCCYYIDWLKRRGIIPVDDAANTENSTVII